MTATFQPQPADILRIDRSFADHHIFTLRLQQPINIAPGQFIEISLAGVGAFPVSISSSLTGAEIQVCVRRTGRVTAALYRLAEGSRVGLRGPFGNSFPLPAFIGRDVLLIAGGCGMAPMMALLEALLELRSGIASITVLSGAHNVKGLLYLPQLQQAARAGMIKLRLSVDYAAQLPWSVSDAELCRVGLVTTLLHPPPPRPAQTTAAVCGPPALYAAVLERLAGLGVPAGKIFATLERRMKCGVGLCCHCVAGGRFVCRDGPVFTLEELRTMKGTI